MDKSIRNISVVVLLTFMAIATIALSVVLLLGFWNSQPVPIKYSVESRSRNSMSGGVVLSDCDEAYVTTIKDATTKELSIRCGVLGKRSEIISLYE